MGIRLSAAVATLVAAASLAAQTTWHVDPTCGDDSWSGLSEVCAAPDGPKRTIQAAMAEAVSGDEVVLADGDYYQSLTTESINFAGQDIVLRSRNGPENCTIHLDGQRPGIVLESGETLAATVRGLTLLGREEATYGGGMAVTDSAVTVVGCVFRRCSRRGGFGGGIFCRTASIVIHDCDFAENGRITECSNDGGAIGARESVVVISGSRFMYNAPWTSPCAGFEDSRGGAIWAGDSSLVVEDSEFTGNAAVGGGAILGDTVELIRCSFTGNRVHGVEELYWSSGGAVRANKVAARDCAFDGNEAIAFDLAACAGGAISANDLELIQCAFYRNRARSDDCNEGYGSGGAISARNIQAVNCLFYDNSATCEAGGMGADTLFAYSSIMWSNSPDQFTIGSGADVTFSDIHGGYPGEGNIDADPLFLDPAAGNFRLRPGSPCIDAGDSSAVPAGITLDLAGLTRFRDDPRTPDTGKGPAPVVDMGAYEFQPPCYADCDGDSELTFFDFLCFQNVFAAADPTADCDQSGDLDFFDFLCFQNAFAAGCE